MPTPLDMPRLLDLYRQREEERRGRIADFLAGRRRFLVLQHAGSKVFGACNSVEMIVDNNFQAVAAALEVPWTDDLPFLEPWIGTGVYANAFGCEYVFRDFDAPHVHYRYHQIDEVKNIDYPDWRKSPIMKMVLDVIEEFKERMFAGANGSGSGSGGTSGGSSGGLPISCTDTQSPFDTATLVLDAAELFTACYSDEEIVARFMGQITDLVIEFSNVQLAAIGPELAMRPGHLGVGLRQAIGGTGLSISDDNLAVSSPPINDKFALPCDQKIADAFGGLCIHSCGNWTQTMSLLVGHPRITMLDCAVRPCDPTPNIPWHLRDALKGSPIAAKVHMAGPDLAIPMLDDLAHPDLRLIVEMGYDPVRGESNYKRVVEKLEAINSNGK